MCVRMCVERLSGCLALCTGPGRSGRVFAWHKSHTLHTWAGVCIVIMRIVLNWCVTPHMTSPVVSRTDEVQREAPRVTKG